MEAGRLFSPPEHTHLVLLEAKHEFQLQKISNDLDNLGIQHHMFFEPDYDRGYTSITTEAISDASLRKYFSRYSLYKYRSEKSFSTQDEKELA